MKLNIITYPHKLLRTNLEEVRDFNDPQLEKIITEMTRLMFKYDGIGLAGNQAGVNKRIIVINQDEQAEVYFNPQVKNKSLWPQKFDEGCISFPGITGFVSRPRKIEIEYQDRQGQKKQKTLHGFYATVFQHEIDHINGIVFTDRIEKFTQGEDQFKKLQAQAQSDEQ